MALIFYQSSLTSAPLPSGFPDKVAHALGYAVLGALLLRALSGGFPVAPTLAMAGWSVALAVAYGITDELHQVFVPGRTADVADLFADGLGAAGGVLLIGLCGILWQRRRGRRPLSRES